MNTPTPSEKLTAKFHISLNVSNLETSVDFYRTLLGQEPAKQKRDYAKFELEEPPVVLSLIPGRAGADGNLNHAGLRVPNADVLVQIQARLEAAGIRTQREEGVECCHSKQTKFWVTDPDRTLWEIYILHEDTDEHSDDSVPEVNTVAFAQNVARARVIWQHGIGEFVAERIPHDNNSVHEIIFEGTANLPPEVSNLPRLFADAFRALRPAGEIRVHGLGGNKPLTQELPLLPGPAAVVRHVPPWTELADHLARAGFTGIRFETFSEKAHFTIGGVEMREFLIVAQKPGHRPAKLSHTAIYLGPLAVVTDDFGNVFRRGEPVPLNIHDWQALSKFSSAGQFIPFAPATQRL